MIKVLIVDDHPIVREGLKQIVKDIDNITVAGEAANGHQGLTLISKNEYDVVVLDIGLPGLSGLDVLKDIKKLKPKLPVLVLSIYPEDQYTVRALKAGASGYLTKKAAPKELVRAIRKAHVGGKYVSPSLAEKLAYYLEAGTEEPPHTTLSDREFQVMIMLAQGKRLKDIGKQLFLSEKTVSTYRSRILQKMRMDNNADITRYVVENSLIDWA